TGLCKKDIYPMKGKRNTYAWFKYIKDRVRETLAEGADWFDCIGDDFSFAGSGSCTIMDKAATTDAKRCSGWPISTCYFSCNYCSPVLSSYTYRVSVSGLATGAAICYTTCLDWSRAFC